MPRKSHNKTQTLAAKRNFFHSRGKSYKNKCINSTRMTLMKFYFLSFLPVRCTCARSSIVASIWTKRTTKMYAANIWFYTSLLRWLRLWTLWDFGSEKCVLFHTSERLSEQTLSESNYCTNGLRKTPSHQIHCGFFHSFVLRVRHDASVYFVCIVSQGAQ